MITVSSSAADQLDAANASLAQQGLDVGLGDVIADLRTTVTLMQTLKTGLGDAMTSVGTLTTDAAAAQKELEFWPSWRTMRHPFRRIMRIT